MSLEDFAAFIEAFSAKVTALITLGHLLSLILLWFLYRNAQDIEFHLRMIRKGFKKIEP